MAFPIVPFLISAITSLPQILRIIGLVGPIKKAIIKAESQFPLNEARKQGKTKEENNKAKHQLALDILWKEYGAHLERYGLRKHEIDTTIKFMVIVVNKIKALGSYRRR
jgi:hypothetical protein